MKSSLVIKLIAGWLALSTAVIVLIALVGAPPNTRAVLLMGTGLVVIWVLIGGMTSLIFRNRIRNLILGIRLDWRFKFVLFATLLALLEEAITTTITNLAPVFGVPLGSAYITASSNYLDVVFLHSVVVFIPMFIGWAVLLRRYNFSPNAVLLLFGITGITAEASFGGTQAFAEFGLWIFVYGLMVYLPAYTLPSERGAKQPLWYHYIMAIFFPVLFSIPVAIIIGLVHPIKIHFLPILPGS
jgi:hypothetical protein